jgi:hypothetical protein
MTLPPRSFYYINEAAARWECCPTDIAGWALEGRLSMMATVSPVACGMEPVAGLVQVNPADIMVLFRRYARSAKSCLVQQILPVGTSVWRYVTNPKHGLRLTRADLLLSADDVVAFEEQCDLLRRKGARRGGGGGSEPRYDWDGMFVEMVRIINEQGMPQKQSDFVSMIIDWFHNASDNGEIPDESTIRKRVVPVWRRLSDLD